MSEKTINKIPNVPNLRFREDCYEWKLIKINSLLRFQNGINASPEKYGKGLKYISVSDILNNRYITNKNIKGMIDIDEKTFKNFEVSYGDILFQRSSEIIEDIGRTNVYLDKNTNSTFGGFVIRGKKIGDYNPIFFKYLLDSPTARKSIIRMGAGSQHYNISQDGLDRIKLFFPNDFIQEKIANLFMLIDSRMEAQSKIIEDLDTLRKWIINKQFVEKSNFAIGQFIEQTSERNKNDNVKRVLSVSNKYGFINQSEQFEDREVASDDRTNYKIVRKNDFAFNPARINVGSISKLNSYDIGIVSPMYICFNCNNMIDDYLAYYFLSNSFKKSLNKRLEGSVRQCLQYDALCSIKLFVPSLNEQISFVNKVNSISKKLQKEKDILLLYKKQKAYLLQNMFI